MGALSGLVSSLCGLWSKKPTIPSSSKAATKESIEERTEDPSSSPPHPHPDGCGARDDGAKPLPPPPWTTPLDLGDVSGNNNNNNNNNKKKKLKLDKSLSSLQPYMSKDGSKRKLSVSLSMKMPTKIKHKASEIKGKAVEIKDDIGHHTGIKNEDTLWNKRIILGEKCRLRNNDADELLDNDIKKRILTKSQSQIPCTVASPSHSRASIDDDAISACSQEEEGSMDRLKGKEKLLDVDD